jgi:hypothetical protein
MGEEELMDTRVQLKHLKNRCRLEAKGSWQGSRLSLESKLGERLQVNPPLCP